MTRKQEFELDQLRYRLREAQFRVTNDPANEHHRKILEDVEHEIAEWIAGA